MCEIDRERSTHRTLKQTMVLKAANVTCAAGKRALMKSVAIGQLLTGGNPINMTPTDSHRAMNLFQYCQKATMACGRGPSQPCSNSNTQHDSRFKPSVKHCNHRGGT